MTRSELIKFGVEQARICHSNTLTDHVEFGGRICEVPQGGYRTPSISRGTINQVMHIEPCKYVDGEKSAGSFHSHPISDRISSFKPSKRDHTSEGGLGFVAYPDGAVAVYDRRRIIGVNLESAPAGELIGPNEYYKAKGFVPEGARIREPELALDDDDAEIKI